MMIKIAVVLCAVMATNMVFASDVDEQALDGLLELMLSEEGSPEDIALQSWFKKTFNKVKHAVKKVAHGVKKVAHGVKKFAGIASGVCRQAGLSPEEARAKILAAYPEMKDQVYEDNFLTAACQGAHAIHGFRG